MIAPEFVLGQGKVSGFLAFFFAVLCLAGVLCFHFPEYLTSAELRAVYQVSFLRSCLAFFLCVAFGLSLVSFILSERKMLSLVSMVMVLVAVLLGGSKVPVPETVPAAPALGLDWFVLDLLILTLVFIPIERLFARLPQQRIFRVGWKVDLVHFFVSHMLVQLTTFLIMSPALFASRMFQGSPVQMWVGSQPLWMQVLEIVVIADFTQYWVHRMFHEIPWLWRFHQIHHSTVEMDWLAGSRLHLVDILMTRSLTLV
ncbi:MAG: sterol desaturase family protein, partial [Bdellovibrionales bacterium]|nr:sterol desaturase family protein [Bdellovibrionales bacterium]